MDEEKMTEANKGELSEFYAFLKVLSDKKIIPADADLVPKMEFALPVLKVFRSEEPNQEKTYDISSSPNNVLIYLAENTEPVVISSESISSKLAAIFSKVLAGDRNNEEINGMMTSLRCQRLRSMPAGSKEDIAMIVHSPSTGQNPRMAYSIKSQVGSPATLLNASGATNFVYEVIPSSGNMQMSELNKTKTARRLCKEISTNSQIKFFNNTNKIFKQNMELIDSAFPELMSLLLLKYYTTDANKLSEIFKNLDDVIILPKSGISMRKDTALYNVKLFLEAVALGMTPSNVWNGRLSATGGYLIVKSDGSLVCYHIFNRDQFENYLFGSTKFESGSEKRHNYGRLYQEENKYLLKLNLQIRFIK